MLLGKTQDARGLDLFAGSGALGIELLSRYGGECTFVDNNKKALDVIQRNISSCRLSDRAHIVSGNFADYLHSTDKCFDIIFIDPPYDGDMYIPALDIIKKRSLLKKGGVIVMECRADCCPMHDGFSIIKDKTYGKVRLCILEEA